MKFNFMRQELELRRSVYKDGHVAIIIVHPDTGNLWGNLTVNTPGFAFPEKELAVKTYGDNVNIAEVIFNTGLFKDTGKRSKNDAGTVVEFWKFKKKSSIREIPAIT